jgi:hypothetical protein
MPRISVTGEQVLASQGRLYSIELASLDMFVLLLFVFLAVQPIAGYGLPVPRGFVITHNDAPQ